MSKREFIEKLSSELKAPGKVDVPVLRAFTREDTWARAEKLIDRLSGNKSVRISTRFNKAVQSERTIYRFSENARLLAFHKSGALQYLSGLDPMEALFAKVDPTELLVENLKVAAAEYQLGAWVPPTEQVAFERLWQIKMGTVTREGQTSGPVLCRIVGAYRHFVNHIPVWGAASATIKLGADGRLDEFSLNLRETSGKYLGEEPVVGPDEGARRLYSQLASLTGLSKVAVLENASIQWAKFGYYASSRRRGQQVLFPVFVAAVDIGSGHFSQGYILVAPATDNALLCPELRGADPINNFKERKRNQFHGN